VAAKNPVVAMEEPVMISSVEGDGFAVECLFWYQRATFRWLVTLDLFAPRRFLTQASGERVVRVALDNGGERLDAHASYVGGRVPPQGPGDAGGERGS